MKTLALIPARGGSKGVPGKNKKEIDGKPLIAYTIEAALDSGRLDDIFVSSDDSQILEIASRYQGIRIHNRRKELASDTSPVTETLNEILNEEELAGNYFDALMILQPTAPIRKGENIDCAIEMLETNPLANSVISVCAMNDVHPARMYWNEEGQLNPIFSEYEQARRQDIPLAYFRNGSIYLVRKESFVKAKSVMAKPIAPLVMPTSWLLNIDEPRDMITAEALIVAWRSGKI